MFIGQTVVVQIGLRFDLGFLAVWRWGSGSRSLPPRGVDGPERRLQMITVAGEAICPSVGTVMAPGPGGGRLESAPFLGRTHELGCGTLNVVKLHYQRVVVQGLQPLFERPRCVSTRYVSRSVMDIYW